MIGRSTKFRWASSRRARNARLLAESVKIAAYATQTKWLYRLLKNRSRVWATGREQIELDRAGQVDTLLAGDYRSR
jgi:hypothetical protein